MIFAEALETKKKRWLYLAHAHHYAWEDTLSFYCFLLKHFYKLSCVRMDASIAVVVTLDGSDQEGGMSSIISEKEKVL